MNRLVVIALWSVAAAWAQTTDTLRLSLHDAMTAAGEASYSARSSEASVRESEASVREARGALLPTFTATASNTIRSYNYAANVPPSMLRNMHLDDNLVVLYNVQDARVATRVPLWNYAAWQRLDAAKQSAVVARDNRDVVGSAVESQAAEAWMALAQATASLRIKEQLCDLARKVLAIAQEQKNSGNASQYDVIRAQGQLATAESRLVIARSARSNASLRLARILHKSMDTDMACADTLAEPVMPTTAELQSNLQRALENRAELRSARHLVAAGTKGRDAVKAERLPSLDLAADYGISAYQFDNSEWTGSVAALLTWTIWDGSRRDARKVQQEERLERARLQLDDLQASVEQEVRSAWIDRQAQFDAYASARQREDLAQQEMVIAQEHYASGMAALPDLITAQNNLSLAADARIDALYRYHLARLNFYRATQQLESL